MRCCPRLLRLKILIVRQIDSYIVELALQTCEPLLVVVSPLAGFALPEIEIA